MGRPSKKFGAAAEENYYEKQSRERIESVIDNLTKRGKGGREVGSAVRRAYPFGERKGKPYKIWNRLVLEYEARLNLR